MNELIVVLKEIRDHAKEEAYFISYPEFFKKGEFTLNESDKQESELSSFEYEYVSQFCGYSGDDYSGYIAYPFKDIIIKVKFQF